MLNHSFLYFYMVFWFWSLVLIKLMLLVSGTGMAGMRQRDLIQWYVSQQNEKNIYNSMEEAANEVSKIKAIIEVKL